MASPNVIKVAISLAVMCMVLGAPLLADGALSCAQVQALALPCIPYIRSPGNGGAPPAACCNAVRTANNQARTTPERQAVCRCLKTTALALPGLNLPKTASLAANCGVNLPYKISPSIDCTKVR